MNKWPVLESLEVLEVIPYGRQVVMPAFYVPIFEAIKQDRFSR